MIAAVVGLAIAVDGVGEGPIEGLSPGCLFPTRPILREEGSIWRFRAARPTVVMVVAYWCDTWKDMQSALGHAQAQPWGKSVDWIVVSADGRWGELGSGWSNVIRLRDPGQEWSRGQIRKVPTILGVAANGAIVVKNEGTLSVQGLQKLAGQAIRTLNPSHAPHSPGGNRDASVDP